MSIKRGNVWELFRWFIFSKQDCKCALCGKDKEIDECELHHIQSKKEGGREEEENLQMLCKLCHRTKMIELYY